MRRKDREITNMEDILNIVKKCEVIRLALFDKEYPYIVPLNFGYSYEGNDIYFYFHCAREGKKLDLIGDNPKAGFELDCSHKLITGEVACNYTMEFESVCGYGTIEQVDKSQKVHALTQIMKQYSTDSTFTFHEKHVEAVSVFKLKVEQITGKALKKS
jgi:nitroimidazol reductase NimA-like FMN-containing flavoprotein (pyridoxamine 5'-phosphate oxidase superfamily)